MKKKDFKMEIGKKVMVNYEVIKNEMEPSTFNLVVPYLDKVGEILDYGNNYATVKFGTLGEFWFREEELIAL